MKCKLAFSMPTPSGRDLEALFQHCRQLGFDGILLHPGHYEGFLGDPASFLGRWGNWASMAAGMIVEASVSTDSGRGHIEQVFDLAVGIDGSMVVLRDKGPRLAGERDRAEATTSALNQLGRRAREYGLQLSVCNQQGGMIEDRADLEVFSAQADPQVVGLALDVGQLAMGVESDPAAIVRDLPCRLENVLFTDVVRSRFPMLEDGRVEIRPPGQGEIDFQAIVDALGARGYEGWLTVADETASCPPLESLRHAAGFLGRLDLLAPAP